MAASFDTVSQECLIRFVEHRVGDRRIIRLIHKWLKAGVLEDEVVTISDQGTGQGSVISPLLANIYLHYAFDQWANRWRRQKATGDMIILRYADDTVAGFEHEADAHRFLEEMRERLETFALSLHPEKTRLIEFGRHAATRRAQRGLGKPETFNFLGFTFICGKSRRGRFLLWRKSRRDRLQTKLAAVKEELQRRMHQPIPRQGEWLRQVVIGWNAYHAVPTNHPITPDVPRLRRRALAAVATATRTARQDDVGARRAASGRLSARAAHPSSLAGAALCRQTPEAGAVCGNAARTVLCGGRAVMRVPTAAYTKSLRA